MNFIGNGFRSTSFRYRPPRLGLTEWEAVVQLIDIGKDIYEAGEAADKAREERRAAEARAAQVAAAAAAAAAARGAAPSEIIPGVPNTITLIGGLAIAGGIGYLAFKK